MKEIRVGEYRCFVGVNAKENWKLLEGAKSSDIFFHLADFPSCYVILETEEEVLPDVISECARICLENTKYRNMRGVYVEYTNVENVRKGEDVGEVIYVRERKVKKLKV